MEITANLSHKVFFQRFSKDLQKTLHAFWQWPDKTTVANSSGLWGTLVGRNGTALKVFVLDRDDDFCHLFTHVMFLTFIFDPCDAFWL